MKERSGERCLQVLQERRDSFCVLVQSDGHRFMNREMVGLATGKRSSREIRLTIHNIACRPR